MEISMLFYYAENTMILCLHRVTQKGIKPLWASS